MNEPLAPGAHVLSAAMKAASSMFARDGVPPSLDGVARALGLPPGELEKIVPDIEALLLRMAEGALQLLQHTFVQSVAQADGDDPIRQFEALADACVEWAYRYPIQSQFIGSMPEAFVQNNTDLLRYRNAIDGVMMRLLRSAQAQGLLKPDARLDVILVKARTIASSLSKKMHQGDLARWNPGIPDVDTARTVMRRYIHKFFR